MDIINKKNILVNELNSIITSYIELNTNNIELNKSKCIDNEISSRLINELNIDLINNQTTSNLLFL